MTRDPVKRVLVTGGTGFVGANLVRRLVQDGQEVHLLVRPAESRWRLASIQDDLFLHEAALQQDDRVRRITADVAPDWVFHLAAYGAYSSQRDVQTIVTTNFNGTVNLVEACLRTGFEAFVNAGSSSEYGHQDHAPAETDRPEPNSHYAATKAAATMFCRFTALRTGRKLSTLRLYSVYGPWEEPTRLVPTLLLQALAGRLPPLVSPGIARDYVYVDDAVDAFILAARSPDLTPGAVLNVGTGIQTSILELVGLVRRQLAVAAEPEWGSMPDRDWDTDMWVSDPRQIGRTLGWIPDHSLERGLAEFTDWLVRDPAITQHYATNRNPPT